MTEQKNFKKAGILIAILVVPAFIVVFLKFFSVQEPKKLETFVPKNTACGIDSTKAYQIPAHQTLDHLGKTFSSTQLDGKVTVVNFILGTDKYEELHYSMSRIQERFKGIEDMKFLSYSIDPATDSLPLLKSLANKFDALPNKWKFLQGDQKLATCIYGTELVEHDSKMKPYQFVLIDKERKIRGYYNGMVRKDIDRLMNEVVVLSLQYEKQKG